MALNEIDRFFLDTFFFFYNKIARECNTHMEDFATGMLAYYKIAMKCETPSFLLCFFEWTCLAVAVSLPLKEAGYSIVCIVYVFLHQISK